MSFISLSALLFVAGLLLTLPGARAEGRNSGPKPAVIIDVRTPAEFAAGHIKDAINIPVDRIGQDIHSVRGIDKNSLILLYCRTGNRSERARQLLIRQGYTQIFNGGGLEDVAQSLPSCSHPQC